ncbi:MAG: DEAD/DEAH box helicase [Syntrophales bacterium]|nr:DEAD/DEAH box helicase [Syntrophales bacterium]
MARVRPVKKNFHKFGKPVSLKKRKVVRLPQKMKPEADPSLKGVFSRIGRPREGGFVPDPFQIEALEAIQEGDCIVTAPTGAGKTWIAEQAIKRVLSTGGRCWFASPLKALSNAKWIEFSAVFGSENVGIVTGDTRENTDAPVLVGTTEILRNKLYDAMHMGEDLPCDLVVLDEAHYLGDPERGVVWEEIIIYLPQRINLLLLSATIGNAEEIASWMSEIRGKPCRVVRELKRPVPLYPLFLSPSGRLMPLVSKKDLFPGVKEFLGFRRRSSINYPYGEIIDVLRVHRLLPAIFFLKSRAECDEAIKYAPLRRELTDDVGFHEDLNELLRRFPYLEHHRHLPWLIKARVAAHHGGQLPAWKFLVEMLMKKGHLDAIFATTTVAAGVNFPARTIVLFNSDMYNGRDFQPMNGTEFHQMIGRAGRRGIDRIGFLVVYPGRFMDVEHIQELLSSGPEDIQSQIKTDFSMVLNLLLSQSPDDIRHILEMSLAVRQSKRFKTAGGLWREFLRHLKFLKAEGFVDEDGRLTENGIWAAKLRLDQPLLIAECIKQGVFPDDPALLAAVVAPFVYDGDVDMESFDRRQMPKKLVRAFERVVDAVSPLTKRLKRAGFPANPLFEWTAMAVYDWARGKRWDYITERLSVAEGDLVMLIVRTADNLRQIVSLKETHPDLAELAEESRELILREPVLFGVL